MVLRTFVFVNIILVCLWCGRSSSSTFPASEFYALEDFYNSLNGEYWFWNASAIVPTNGSIIDINIFNASNGAVWNFTGFNNPCAEGWQGISCDCSTVAVHTSCSLASIDLTDFNLTGQLPTSISNFTNLKTLNLNYNSIVGTVPIIIGSLNYLTVLNLAYNEFNSSIPYELGNCSNLVQLYLEYNNFTGSLPVSLYSLSRLSRLKVTSNKLVGELSPLIGQWFRMKYLFLGSNFFSGTVPSEIANCSRIMELYLDHNTFHGTIPSAFQVLPNLIYLDLYQNSFYGTIPSWLGTSSRLFCLDAGQNVLYGTIPNSLCGDHMKGLFLNTNHLYGPIPNCFSGENASISDLVLDGNVLSGHIPPEFGFNRKLKALVLSYNKFEGSLPRFQSTLMQVLYVQSNKLSGNLYDVFNGSQRNIQYLDFSDNSFSGSIPQNFYGFQRLQSIVLVSNCFTGSITQDICRWTHLEYLDFDGLHTADKCQVKILPPLKSYLMRNNIKGSIPGCLFSLQHLQTIHLSGNAIDCSLPSVLNISNSITDITLSHNMLRGPIPLALQTRSFETLDLSFNCFDGVLYSEFNVSDSTKLEVNRLSGAVPKPFMHSHHINILDGNLFTCDLDRRTLPHHDPKRHNYECGSNAFDNSIVLWFVGIFPILVCGGLGYWALNVENSDSLISIRKMYWDSYVYYKLCMQVFVSDPSAKMQTAIVEFAVYMERLRTTFFRLTLGMCVVLLPLYIALSSKYATHTYQYAWNASALYLSGETPALTLMFVFLGLLLIIFLSLRSFLWRWLSQEVFVDHETGSQSQVVQVQFNRRRFVVLCLIAVVNCGVMLMMNGIYVLFVFEASTGVVFLCQLVISAFKIAWNEYALTWMVSKTKEEAKTEKSRPISIRSAGRPVSVRSEGESDIDLRRWSKDVDQMDLSKLKEQQDLQREEDAAVMPALTFIVIFNSIIAPVLANAILSQECYQGVFIYSGPISSDGSYSVCQQDHTLQLTNAKCLSTTDLELTTSYDPPFIYRYECSSSFIRHYASVYVYMFLLSGLKPVFFGILKYIYDTTKSSGVKIYVSSLLNILLKEDKFDHKRVQQSELLFRKERFVLNNVSATVVLMTVGVIFPPVAVVVLFAIYSHTFFNQFLIGRFVNCFRGLNQELIVKALCKDCEGVPELFKYSSLIMLPFISCFYAIFVLDIYGDAVEWRQAIWASIVVFVAPLFGYSFYQLYRLLDGVMKRRRERLAVNELIVERRRAQSMVDMFRHSYVFRPSFMRWRSTVSAPRDVNTNSSTATSLEPVVNPVVVEMTTKNSS